MLPHEINFVGYEGAKLKKKLDYVSFDKFWRDLDIILIANSPTSIDTFTTVYSYVMQNKKFKIFKEPLPGY